MCLPIYLFIYFCSIYTYQILHCCIKRYSNVIFSCLTSFHCLLWMMQSGKQDLFLKCKISTKLMVDRQSSLHKGNVETAFLCLNESLIIEFISLSSKSFHFSIKIYIRFFSLTSFLYLWRRLIDWYKWYVNLSRVILCLEVRELYLELVFWGERWIQIIFKQIYWTHQLDPDTYLSKSGPRNKGNKGVFQTPLFPRRGATLLDTL